MKKLNKRGFTIVELVIVIAVIAILAAVLIPTFGNVIKKANESAAVQTAASFYKEVMAIDLSDGTQDGYEGEKGSGDTNKISKDYWSTQKYELPSSISEFTYTVTDSSVTFTVTMTNGYKVERSSTTGEFTATKS